MSTVRGCPTTLQPLVSISTLVSCLQVYVSGIRLWKNVSSGDHGYCSFLLVLAGGSGFLPIYFSQPGQSPVPNSPEPSTCVLSHASNACFSASERISDVAIIWSYHASDSSRNFFPVASFFCRSVIT